MKPNHLMLKQAIIDAIFLFLGTTIIYHAPLPYDLPLWKGILLACGFQFVWNKAQRFGTVALLSAYFNIRKRALSLEGLIRECNLHFPLFWDSNNPHLVSMICCVFGVAGKHIVGNYGIVVVMVLSQIILINCINYSIMQFKK